MEMSGAMDQWFVHSFLLLVGFASAMNGKLRGATDMLDFFF